jgi:hypothetical protein
LRFYGTSEEFYAPDIVPQVFIDELLRMPLVSRGQIIMDVIRVQELYTTDGEEVFVAAIPSQREEREISFEFEPETPSNIGCNLCSLPIGNELSHYCSAVCAQRASIMSCATCGHESHHVCSGCNAIGYCSAQCQHSDWNQIHSQLCSIEAGVKRLQLDDDDDDDDENRNVRRRERGVVLPTPMDMRMNNVRFLKAYIEQHGLDYIRQHVWAPSEAEGPEGGVEAALRENNLFWFLVRQYMQSREEFNPLVNYRDLLA